MTWRQKTVPVDYKEGEGLGLGKRRAGKDLTTKITEITKPESNVLGHGQEVKEEPAAQTCRFNLVKKNENFYPRKAGLGWAGLRR